MAARKKNSGGTRASTPAAKKRAADKRAAAKKRRPADDTRDDHGRFAKPNAWTWKPGTSGNPKGRPKRRTLSEDLFEFGQHGLPEAWRKKIATALGLDPDDPKELARIENLTMQQAAAAMLWIKSLADGDMKAFQEIFDRLDQKPKRVEITGRDGGPVQQQVSTSEMSKEDAAGIYKQILDGDELDS